MPNLIILSTNYLTYTIVQYVPKLEGGSKLTVQVTLNDVYNSNFMSVNSSTMYDSDGSDLG